MDRLRNINLNLFLLRALEMHLTASNTSTRRKDVQDTM